MNKIDTVKLQGKDYATVPSRILAFREENPKGSITTKKDYISELSQWSFQAHVVKDRGDETSADATGSSLGIVKGEKDFEKLETIAVGRALANLGYLASGNVASSEEMEAFYEEQENKRLVTASLFAAKAKLNKAMESKGIAPTDRVELVKQATGSTKIKTLEDVHKVEELLEV